MDLPSSLTQRLGPLPRWVWGVGIIGGAGIGLYLRSRPSKPARESEETAGIEPADTSQLGTAGGLPYGGSYGGIDSSWSSGTGFTTGDLERLFEDNARRLQEANQDWLKEFQADFVANAPAYQPPEVSYTAPPSVNQIVDPPPPPEISGGGGPPASPARAPQPGNQQQRHEANNDAEAARRQAEEDMIRARVDIAMTVRGREGRNKGKLIHQVFGRDRARVTLSARNHPNWGPYTLARGGQFEGHSIAF